MSKTSCVGNIERVNASELAGGERVDATEGKPSVVDYLGFQFESIELVPGGSVSPRLATIDYEDSETSLQQTEGMDDAFLEGLNEFGLEHAHVPLPMRGSHRAVISPREIDLSGGKGGRGSELEGLLRRNLIRRTGTLEDRREWSNRAPTRGMDSTPVTRNLNTADPSESTRTRTDWSAPLIVEKVSFDDLLTDRQRRKLYNSSSDSSGSSDEDTSAERGNDEKGRQDDEEVVVGKGKGRMRTHEAGRYASTTALAELESNGGDSSCDSVGVYSALTEITDEDDSSDSETQPTARGSKSGKAKTSSLYHPRDKIVNEAIAEKKPSDPPSHRCRSLAAMPQRERLGVITNVHRARSRRTNNASEDEQNCEGENEESSSNESESDDDARDSTYVPSRMVKKQWGGAEVATGSTPAATTVPSTRRRVVHPRRRR